MIVLNKTSSRPALASFGAALVAMYLASSPAQAVTFRLIDVTFGAIGPTFGTFDAPLGGGPVTNLTATLFNDAGERVVFDKLEGISTDDPGIVFSYLPSTNDFNVLQAEFTPSQPSGLCPSLQCFLAFRPSLNALDPSVYSATDQNGNSLGPRKSLDDLEERNYAIAPIPVPSTLFLLLTGIGSSCLLGRLRWLLR